MIKDDSDFLFRQSLMKQALLHLFKRALPARIRNSILHVGFNIAPDRFAELAFLYGNAADMEHGLRSIAQRGYSPKAVLDVGAYHGSWSAMARRVWPTAEIIMIEANTDKKQILQSIATEINAMVHFELLGSEANQVVDFHVMESGSSVYEENSPLHRRIEVRRTATVDSVLGERKIDLMKIDVQGFELEVLKGATSAISHCSVIILEISLLEINSGAPLLHDVVAFMKERGFVAYEFVGIHRRPLDRAMNQVDMLFVPENSALRSDKSHFMHHGQGK